MKLIIAGSSSAGNGYVLQASTKEAIVIEAGVPFTAVKRLLDFDTRCIAAAVISHEHVDHAKFAKEYATAGIPVMASEGTLEALKMKGHTAKRMISSVVYEAGEFQIMGFKVKHDAAEPFGFLIQHPEAGKILFITDTAEINYDFNGLTQIMIEANYSEEIAYQKMMNGELNARHQDRVTESHMSLEATKKFLQRTDLASTNNIVLIHLSSSNSNAQEFKRSIELQTGKTVTIADKGININFSKTPF